MMNNDLGGQFKENDHALFQACSKGDNSKVVSLISNGADATTLINGFSSLHISTKKNHIATVAIILELYPLIATIRTNDGRNALHIAAFEGHLDIALILVSRLSETETKSVDSQENTALHYSAWGGNLECCKLLVEQCHLDVNAKNYEGLTPLQVASAGNHKDIIEYFLSQSETSLDMNTSASGHNILHRAVMYGSMGTVQYLLSNTSINVVATNAAGNNVLHLAAQNGMLDILKYLLGSAYGASFDINAQNSWGMTPLHFSCVSGHTDIAAYLLSKGANSLLKTQTGATPLHLAAGAGKHEISRMLANESAVDLWAEDDELRTPIDMAISSGFKELASRIACWSYVSDRTKTLLAGLENVNEDIFASDE